MTGRDPTLDVEHGFSAAGHRYVAGCDEVGRGALAGPVTVGVVVIDLTVVEPLVGVRDSKLLSVPARSALVPAIRDWAVGFGVGHASAAEIDERGLTAALRLAGMRALATAATTTRADVVLLDGKHNWLAAPEQPSLFDSGGAAGRSLDVPGPEMPGFDVPVMTRIKADMQCQSVAAASVLAKVERDEMMVRYAADHPGYGWEINKGYATARHREALTAHGVASLHRKSWRLPGVARA